jgi:hypothetical protein
MDRKQIEEYLIKKQIDRSKKDPYGDTAIKFNTDRETIRDINRQLRKKKLVETDATNLYNHPVFDSTTTTQSISFNNDAMHIETTSDKEVTSIDDLAKVCKIDLKQWTVVKGECKKRDVLVSTNGDKKVYKPIFSVSATIKKIKVEESREAQLDILKEVLGKNRNSRLRNFLINKTISKIKSEPIKKEYLYELSIPDVHFGKLAHRDESGEDYDIKIATERYRTAVDELLNEVNLNRVERILFPVGNDMVHIDSRKNETFEGTRQDSDSRFYKIVRTVKNILIETIDRLSIIAPVDVLVVSGNHDPESMFMIGEMLDAYYHNDDRVSVDNSPSQRKYYQYGINGFQYTHGNEENHKDLGLIFATEKSQLWADTTYRVVKTGHFHKKKKIDYVSVDEYQGFQVQVLPSLSGADAWHTSKGFRSLKGAKGFLYHPTRGCVGEFNYNVLNVK